MKIAAIARIQRFPLLIPLFCWCLVLFLHASGPSAAGSPQVEVGEFPPADAIALETDGVQHALDALPATVDEIMRRSGVPGLAVAVVHRGETVFSRGFGVRELGKNLPVEPETVFQLASISKSVSATVAAIQIAKGAARWDDPIVKYLPAFKLNDAYVTSHATIGDLFSHRSGLPHEAGDDLEELGFDRATIIERLAQLPLGAFRTSYAYANFGTTIAGEAVAAAANTGWETLANELLFQPLGMTATSYAYEDLLSQSNRAELHALEDGRFQPLYSLNVQAQAPAGSLSSNVVDMAEWLKLLLAGGTRDGKALFTPEAIQPALTAQSFSARAQQMDARSGFYGYGFNVNVEANGRTSMGHSGAFVLGASTSFKIVPSADLGIIVLTNGAPVGATEAIVTQFVDTALYGQPTRDWFDTYHTAFAGILAPRGDLVDQSPPASASPANKLDAYIGTYANPYYGSAEIKRDGGGLALVLGPKKLVFPLQHWDGDTFAMAPAGEGMAKGSLGSVSFKATDAKTSGFTADLFNDAGLGTWDR